MMDGTAQRYSLRGGEDASAETAGEKLSTEFLISEEEDHRTGGKGEGRPAGDAESPMD